jgi:TonB family protein
MSINTRRLSLVLNSKPDRSSALVMQAIIIALLIHVFVLGVMYLVTAAPAGDEQEAEETLEELKIELVEEEELLKEQEEIPSKVSAEVRNLLANAAGKRTSRQVNYTGKSRDAMESEVEQSLEEYEQSIKNEIAREKGEIPERKPEQKENTPTKSDKNTAPNSDPKNNSEESYSGPVSAEFDLAGRYTKKAPKPMYRCKSFGVVVVNIKVDPTGAVLDAQINEARSTGNECLRQESLSYAKRWAFDYKDSAPKKQEGSITFTFTEQR